ncbi:hypothetical protein [Sphingomonas piscis]|uniref:hypothetical protein n=1 Tax=Sphingomonas piscis TaxID=2714943 RepID=UPI001FEA36DA|nr:hypothetical protein [Sphingomonas piscis]
MIEAAMIWNEPNNKSHWDPAIDPDWKMFADHVIAAGNAIRAVNPQMTRVLGGMSPIDTHWLKRIEGMARSTPSTWSRCTAFRSTGICGRSAPGRTKSMRSGR